jgi:hypothetical protein
MIKTRAIYLLDSRFENMPVFELDEDQNKFFMLDDEEFKYDTNEVFGSEDWIVMSVDLGNDTVKLA